MWQVLVGVIATTGTLLSGFLILQKIVLRTVEQTAMVLVASLNPPITDERQPVDQPDLLDPNWTPGPEGLPIPPWMPGSEQSPYSTSS